MELLLTTADRLSDAQLADWRELVDAQAAYDSPFYAPAFTLAVAANRSDVEVAVARSGGKFVGFFPFQRASRRIGRPVGWRLNDFQGAITAAGSEFDPLALLAACRLSQWRFDHLPTGQSWCRGAHINLAESPAIDVSAGYQGYLAARRLSGSSLVITVQRKARKLHREVGPLRFEFDSKRDEVLETLLRWKSDQLQRTGSRNELARPWARGAIEALRRGDDPQCRGVLSALYSGERLVAAHFGICNSRVLHWWITAYNSEVERCSPGSVLLLHLVEACADRGIQRLDLGKGTEHYKRQFMTSAAPLAEGAIASTAWRQAHQRLAYRTTASLRASAWMRPAIEWMKQFRPS